MEIWVGVFQEGFAINLDTLPTDRYLVLSLLDDPGDDLLFNIIVIGEWSARPNHTPILAAGRLNSRLSPVC